MNTQDFQQLIEDSKLRALPKQYTTAGNVLLAEGFFESHPKFHKPHWQVWWAIERSESAGVAQALYIEPRGEHNGIYRKWTRQERINSAVTTAMQFMKDEGKKQVYFG